MSALMDGESQEALENEIADLELQLVKARERLKAKAGASQVSGGASSQKPHHHTSPLAQTVIPDTSHHYLLLLSDSALPLGSFAFSSGLESYLAHSKTSPQRPSFSSFLPVSLSSYASTTLPFVLAAHRDPSPGSIAALDDALDASIICAVGRRASVAQGRALLSIWEKSFAGSSLVSEGAREGMRPFAALLRRVPSSSSTFPATSGSAGAKSSRDKGPGGGEGEEQEEELPPPASAHLAPLFGAIAHHLGLGAAQTAYVFMLSHVKALVSAAVRASMFGPYMAQKILAGGEMQGLIGEMVAREWETAVEDAAQSVPVMDLWIGRHEVLYSRIFNS
ncbi:UreF-domain-containing protein [Xylariaceae sp. FL0016]|nr:UreF-domain-containing protein [Xylariaceae sp. FL0016]